MVRKNGLGDPSQVLTDQWGHLLEEMIRDQLQEPRGPRSPSVTGRRQNRWDQLVHVLLPHVGFNSWFDRVSCLLKLEGTRKMSNSSVLRMHKEDFISRILQA